MATFLTTQGNDVFHCHVGDPPPCDRLPQVTLAQMAHASARLAIEFPNAIEVRPATFDYNCYGLAFTRSHGWFELALSFLNDDHTPRQMSGARVGDVVLYILSDHSGEEPHEDNIGHAALVTRVENGQITQLISKWGANPEVLHTLTEVPASFGAAERLYRRAAVNPPAPDGVENSGENSTDGGDMNKDEIGQALQSLSEDEVRFQLMMASTENVRRHIIASMPEVRTLIEHGQEAGEAVVEFFEQEQVRSSPYVSGVALYLLEHIPSEEGARAVARSIEEGTVSAMNRNTAAKTFLTLRHIDPEGEDLFERATREVGTFLRGE